MEPLNWPIELFQNLIDTLVALSSVRRALQLRLVCSHFNREILRSLPMRPRLLENRLASHMDVSLQTRALFLKVIAVNSTKCHLNSTIHATANALSIYPGWSIPLESVQVLCCVATAHMRSEYINRHMKETECDNSTIKLVFETIPAVKSDINNVLVAAVYVGDNSLAQAMLKEGAAYDCDTEFFGRPLQHAIKRGHNELVRLLLEMGANVYPQDGRFGQTPLQAAAGAGNSTAVDLLLDPIRKLRRYGHEFEQAIMVACSSGHGDIAFSLLARMSADKTEWKRVIYRMYHEASSNGRDTIVQRLMGVYPKLHINRLRCNWKSRWEDHSWTALQMAANRGHTSLVRLLLDNGADRDYFKKGARSIRYGNALSLAVSHGHQKTVQVLLDHGADVNGKGGHMNPIVAATMNGQLHMLRFLLDCGANVHAPLMTPSGPASEESGTKALSHAIPDGFGEIAQVLLEAGARIGYTLIRGYCPFPPSPGLLELGNEQLQLGSLRIEQESSLDDRKDLLKIVNDLKNILVRMIADQRDEWYSDDV